MNVLSVFATMKQNGYTERESQKRMAQNIEWGIENGRNMIFEAPTGTGKSLAYLIPAILAGRKTVITTNNKNLQNQIYIKDIPGALALTGLERTATLLKGRSNYLCTLALDAAKSFIDGEIREKILAWGASGDGDLANAPEFIDPKWFEHIGCSEYIDHSESALPYTCYHQEAKARAEDSDIVIVNHTLLAIDGYLRLETAGNAALLPDHEILIIDEAHEFAESVKRALEDSLSTVSLRKFFTQIGAAHLSAYLSEFERILRECEDRPNGIIETIDFTPIVEAIRTAPTATEEQKKRKRRMIERLEAFGTPDETEGRWVATKGDKRERIAVYRKKLAVGDILPDMCYRDKTVFATSATLATSGDFSFIRAEIGLSNAKVGAFSSPFDYEKNTILYIPKTELSESEKVRTLEKLLRASKGRAFVLFTSIKDMMATYETVSSPYPIILQGENGKTAAHALSEFKAQENAVLFGLRSFWQGVDIQGDALSLVVIWRLPFEYWGDPIVQILAKKMKNHFRDKYLPDCIINLKQGVGRLIRTETDRGALAILDRRVEVGYGGRILLNLPRCERTANPEKVRLFLEGIYSHNDEKEYAAFIAEKGLPENHMTYNHYMNEKWKRICRELNIDPRET